MIIDYLGGVNQYDLKDDIVAFEQGNSLLLFDTVQNTKIKMHNHSNPIKAVQFCNGTTICSLSMGYKNQLIISDYSTLTRLYSDYLPQTELIVSDIFMKYDNNLYIIEVYNGYRLIVYDVKEYKILYINDLEKVNPCFGFVILNTKPKQKLCALELNQMKIYQTQDVKLTNILSMSSIRHVSINKTLLLIVVILQNGSLYILNQDGDLISQLKSSQQTFTCACSFDTYLYLGNENGKILVYEVSSLNFVKEIQAGQYPIDIRNSNSLLVYKLNDGSIFIKDIIKSNLIDSIIGHSGRINKVLWDPMNNSQFYSGSNDGCFGVVQSKGDKFTMQKYQISTLTKIKCVLVDNFRDDLYIGDSRGQLLIFSLLDFQFKRMVQLSQNLSLKRLEFSPAYQYLGVVFKNGFSIILDSENQLKPMLKLEDSIQNVKYCSIKLYQIEYNIVKLNTNTLKSYYLPRQDKHFNSLTLMNQHSVRQHQIEKGDNMLSALAVNIFTVDGIVFGFDLHPSKEYIFILSSFGFVYIFKIQSGEQRAKITVPPFSRNLTIDKSGLFFAIAHLSLAPQDGKFLEVPTIEYLTTNVKLNTKTLPTNVRVYECGTGNISERINNIYYITHLEFSNDSQYIIIAGKNGKLSLWGLNEDILDSAKDVIQNLKVNPFFWKDYPIYIDEEDVQEQEILDLTLISRKPIAKQINKTSKFQYTVNPKIQLI
ncbi:hypothetical protein pb186bvf_008878 [Paramecium bursaria]